MSTGTLADGILGYLAAHPDAEATLEGIGEWWVFEQRVRGDTVALTAALAQLVKEGRVVKFRGRDGRWRFKAQRRRNPGAPIRKARRP
jgi:hypothetical protein